MRTGLFTWLWMVAPLLAANEPWRVAAQPELKQALDQAPVLQTESLGEPALGFDGKYYIATPSRKTWSVNLFVYDPATNTIEPT